MVLLTTYFGFLRELVDVNIISLPFSELVGFKWEIKEVDENGIMI